MAEIDVERKDSDQKKNNNKWWILTVAVIIAIIVAWVALSERSDAGSVEIPPEPAVETTEPAVETSPESAVETSPEYREGTEQ